MSLYTRPSMDTSVSNGVGFLPGNRRHYLAQDDLRLQTAGTKEKRETMFRVEQRNTMLADDEKKMQPSRLRPDRKIGKRGW